MVALIEVNPLTEARDENKENPLPVHTPVMLEEVIGHLHLKEGDTVVDGTIGTAGHSVAIMPILGAQGCLIGIDRDKDSLQMAARNLEKGKAAFHLAHDDFRNIDRILHNLNIQEVDAMVFDLGVSSFQLNDSKRGFSLKWDGPLDMRMDQDSFISAYDLVNSLSEDEISSIIRNFGEERWHKRIARALVARRSSHPIESTKELTEIILEAMPYRFQRQGIHPATRTFQAFRIAVNRELEALEVMLNKSLDVLKVGGRIAVISFHSLEDRIVKNKFRGFAQSGRLELIFKKPLRPGEKEVTHNPRSRSARLRVAKRIR